MDKDLPHVEAIQLAAEQLRQAIRDGKQAGLQVIIMPTRNALQGDPVDPEKMTVRIARDYQQYDVRGNVI